MSKTAATDELVEKFYAVMPFKDVKLTSCNEKPELIIEMEKLAALQCAIISLQSTIDCLKGMMIKDWNDDFEKCWYNDQIESKISEIESQIKELTSKIH